MGPGSITRYARPARLWRIGTEHSPRSIVHHDGEVVDALRMCASASSLSSKAHAGRLARLEQLPARGLLGVLRLSVGRFGEAGLGRAS
jgi:hypothetical protein